MKSRSREIDSLNYRIALRFNRHIDSSAAQVPVKFQSDWTIIYQIRGFGTSRDLTIRRLFGYWNRALGGPVSTSDKTSYCEILWSLKAARLVVWIIASLWNLTGSMSCLSNIKRSDNLNSEPGVGGGGYSEKFWRGVRPSFFRNHTLGYGDRGPKSYPWLWKMGQNQTLGNRKYHKINHFWSNFAWNW